jgi:dihydrofolate reductase
VRTSLVAAVAENEVIGHDGGLPWHLPADLRHFRELTAGHVVVVGRRTQESIVSRLGRPLPERISVVVTSRPGPDSALLRHRPSVPAALSAAWEIEKSTGGEEVFVIGGAAVYAVALSDVEHVYLTRVHENSVGDARMPADWLTGFRRVQAGGPAPARDGQPSFSFEEYERG